MLPSWWPSPEQPLSGVFNQSYVLAMRQLGAGVGVIFPDLVHPRHMRRGRGSPPIFPRIHQESLQDCPIIRVRGVHTALRQPAIQMHRFLRWTRRALRHLEKRLGRPDIIHAFCSVPAGYAAAQLARELDIPFVITEHTGPFADVMTPARQAAFANEAIASCGAFVAVSGHQAGQMRQCGITREIHVIPNPVASHFDHAPPPSPRAIDGRRRCRALYVGRTDKAKGIESLIAVAIRMMREEATRPERPTVEWHFVGDGPLTHELRTRLSAQLPSDAFAIHGILDSSGVARQMADADFIVHPSHGETFGLSVAEALCRGRPVVTTRDTGCEAMIHDANGVLCDIGDNNSLHDAICDLLDRLDRYDSASISRAACGQFAMSQVAGRYADLYHRLLSQ